MSFLLNKVWSLNVPSKAKHLLLRVCHNLLPTYHTIRRNIVVVDDSCFSFDGEDVDVIHTLFKCEYARAVWFASPLNFRVDTIAFNSPCHVVASFCVTWPTEMMGLWAMVAWGIWFNRHIRCQGKQGFDPINLINTVLTELHEFQNQNQYAKMLLKRNIEGLGWVAPQKDTVKISCHISHFYLHGFFFGCVIRDEMGDVLGSLARILNVEPTVSIIDAYERMVHESLVFGLDMGFRSITIESDYLPIVCKLQLIEWEASNLAINISQSTQLEPNDYNFKIAYILPENNCLAESVADYALYEGRSNIWIEELPPRDFDDLV